MITWYYIDIVCIVTYIIYHLYMEIAAEIRQGLTMQQFHNLPTLQGLFALVQCKSEHNKRWNKYLPT